MRQASRRCDIAYEFKDGSVAYDDIPDPLPFDINAPVIEIPEEFFGVCTWIAWMTRRNTTARR